MSLYRVSCILVSRKDDSQPIPVSLTDKHPDLVKGFIEKKYPNHDMTQINIEDITQTGRMLDGEKGSRALNSNRAVRSHRLDIDSTWHKEIAR